MLERAQPDAIIHDAMASVAEHLQRDDLYLQEARQGRRVLRFWQGCAPAVVLGHSERANIVLHEQRCMELGIPILRRQSGGGAVLQAFGVINYALTMPDTGALDVQRLFRRGTDFMVSLLRRLGVDAYTCGVSDVAVGDRKISGSAQARRRGALLLHGTLLLAMDYDLVEAVLRHPPREPAYRAGRGHRAFMVTLQELGMACSMADVVRAGCEAAQDQALIT